MSAIKKHLRFHDPDDKGFFSVLQLGERVSHGTYFELDNGSMQETNIVSHGEYGHFPTLVNRPVREGKYSLRFDHTPCPDNRQSKDRMELVAVSREDSFCPWFDRRFYYSFWLYFDKECQNPRKGHFTILSQAHQHLELPNGSGAMPPFVFAMNDEVDADPDGPIEVMCGIANDDNLMSRQRKTIWTDRLERERWYRFTFALFPSHVGQDEKGTVAIYKDRNKVKSWRGHWGYDPDSEYAQSTGMDVRLGVYRRYQQRRVKFYIDDVKIGTQYRAVG